MSICLLYKLLPTIYLTIFLTFMFESFDTCWCFPTKIWPNNCLFGFICSCLMLSFNVKNVQIISCYRQFLAKKIVNSLQIYFQITSKLSQIYLHVTRMTKSIRANGKFSVFLTIWPIYMILEKYTFLWSLKFSSRKGKHKIHYKMYSTLLFHRQSLSLMQWSYSIITYVCLSVCQV